MPAVSGTRVKKFRFREMGKTKFAKRNNQNAVRGFSLNRANAGEDAMAVTDNLSLDVVPHSDAP